MKDILLIDALREIFDCFDELKVNKTNWHLSSAVMVFYEMLDDGETNNMAMAHAKAGLRGEQIIDMGI